LSEVAGSDRIRDKQGNCLPPVAVGDHWEVIGRIRRDEVAVSDLWKEIAVTTITATQEREPWTSPS